MLTLSSMANLIVECNNVQTPACPISGSGTNYSSLTEVYNTECGLLAGNNMPTAITRCCVKQQCPTQVPLANNTCRM